MITKTQPESHHESSANVFISHSRRDKVFVRRLDEALTEHGREAWVDTESITPTADFWPEVYSGIEGTDAFIFVISPDSVRSEDCLRELTHAVEHNKRLVPIVYREVDDIDVPEPLRSPQWVFFRDKDDFEDSLRDLVDALNTDLEWLQEHTRLLTRAIEWEKSGRDRSSVLRGSDLRTAEDWQVRAADKEPKLTPLQSEYLLASRREERRRQGLTLGAVMFGLIVAAVLGVFAWSQRNEAVDQRNKAERQASIALGRQLAAQAQLSAEQTPQPLQRSVLLALEARKQSPLPSFEADQILRDALTVLPRSVARLSHQRDVEEVAFSPDGDYLATTSYTTARVWDASSGKEVARMSNDDGPISSVAFSPDSKYLATVSGKALHVWQTTTGDETGRITIAREGEAPLHVADIAFSADGKYLYIATSDEAVRVWDPITGEEVARMEGSVSAFSQNGKYLATSGEKTARVIDMSSGEEIARVDVGESAVVALSPDGNYLAGLENPEASTATIARVWETSSGEEITRVSQEAPAGTGMVGITSVVLGPSGKYLATVGTDRTVSTWDTSSGKEIARITHEDDIRHIIKDVAFSPDGDYLATAGADDTARIWDLTSTREYLTMTDEAGVVEVAFSPDGKYLATTSADETVRVWDLSNSGEVARIEKAAGATFSPEGRYLAVESSDGTVGVWGTSSGKEITRLTQQSVSPAFSPNGEYLATVSSDQDVQVWEMPSGQEVARISHDGSVEDVALSPDGRYLATTGIADTTARVWEISSGQEVARITHDNGAYMDGSVDDVAFSRDGRYLATASDDRTVRLWDPNSGDEIARLNHNDGVVMLAFGPHGKYLATASGRLPMIRESGELFTAHIWNLSNGEEVARMTHENIINMVAFSPDGRYLATASDDQTARVWEVPSGQEVARITQDDSVQDVAFSPNGRYLATESSGTARAWLWRQPEDLREAACSRLTRNLTEKEWQQYLGGQPYHETCKELPKPTA